MLRFINFFQKYENYLGIEFFKLLIFIEVDLIDIIVRMFLIGLIEGLIVVDVYDQYVNIVKKWKKRNIEEFKNYVKEIGEGINVNIDNIFMKINCFYYVLKGLEVENGVIFNEMMKNLKEISVFIIYFIERFED